MGQALQSVALFPTCVVDTVAPEVGEAAVRVLRRLGATVSMPDRATCCGQPAWNAGFAEEAAEVARTTLDALAASDAEVICVPAGSCATMIRVFWPELFHLASDDGAAETARAVGAKVREFAELVASAAPQGGRFDARVAYHHSCHMLRELRIKDAPEQLLDGVEGCARVVWSGDDRCCGFGGLFALKQPETSLAMADDKLDGVERSGATHLVGCDQSCLLHLQGRLRRRGDTTTEVLHLAQVLDRAGAGPVRGE
jgi:L-lactate dehydrogenase complex protein LldE